MTFLTEGYIRTFAKFYPALCVELKLSEILRSSQCSNLVKLPVCYELVNQHFEFDCRNGISIFSDKNSRALPIKFALAELLWILSGSRYLQEIVRWNASMSHFSDDGLTLNGAYGRRLQLQFMPLLGKLELDKNTRQACAAIYYPDDVLKQTKDVPCNCLLQFLIRDDKLSLIVTARSIDAVTGLPIDVVHWQFLLHLVCNSLKRTYPDLKVSYLHYNIGSLHVYSIDKDQFDMWDLKSSAANYTLATNDTLEDLIARSQKFESITTFEELLSIYKFDCASLDDVYELATIFKSRKFKVVR